MVSARGPDAARSRCLVVAYGTAASGWYPKVMVAWSPSFSYGPVTRSSRPTLSYVMRSGWPFWSVFSSGRPYLRLYAVDERYPKLSSMDATWTPTVVS